MIRPEELPAGVVALKSPLPPLPSGSDLAWTCSTVTVLPLACLAAQPPPDPPSRGRQTRASIERIRNHFIDRLHAHLSPTISSRPDWLGMLDPLSLDDGVLISGRHWKDERPGLNCIESRLSLAVSLPLPSTTMSEWYPRESSTMQTKIQIMSAMWP